MTSDLYLKDLATTLYQFQNGNILCDTVLIADDCKVWAHSVILAAVSPYIYANCLSISGHKAKCRFSMKLAGCNSASLKAVLHFIYTGSLVLPSSFQQLDKFSGILLVFERMGINVKKLNGVAVKFDDLCRLETSTDEHLESIEESIHGAAAFDSCLDTEKMFGIATDKEVKLSDASVAQEQSCLPEELVMFKPEKFVHPVVALESELEKSRIVPDVGFLKLKTAERNIEIGITMPEDSEVPDVMQPPGSVSRIISSIVSHGSSGSWISLLKGNKSSTRRSTSVKLAAKILQKLTKKNRMTEVELGLIQRTSSDKDVLEIHIPATDQSADSEGEMRVPLNLTKATDALKCRLCGKTFTSAEELGTHEKLHADDRPHVCATCGKTYRFRSSLIQHSQIHSEKHPYLCDICGSSFALAVNLRRHTMSRHSSVRPFVCSECGRGFVRDYLLREHMESHTGKRTNVCPLCSKSFSHRGNLNRHVRDHNGEKRYVCIVCAKPFNRKSNMEKHVLLHSGRNCAPYKKELRRHTCAECHKIFRTEKMLSRHASIHSSERSFTCNVCTKGFTTLRYLHQHKVVHQEKQYKCDACSKLFASEHFRLNHIKKFHPDSENTFG